MPAKHSARPLGPARIFLSAAAAVLVMLVVWIAVRAVGPAEAARQPSTVVLPSMPQISASPSPTSPFLSPSPSSSPSPSMSSASPSASASPSRSSARPTATSHSPTPSKPAPAKTTPPPSADFAVTVTVTASWDQGYVAQVRVRNNGDAAGSWSVTVSHADLNNLHLVSTWNATGKQSGDNVVFTGGPLAPGASAGFGYQVSKTGRGNARPSGCAVVGGSCRVS
ncbi:cellulose-binding domain-containing protein [Actinoplanes sp. KI2]|uniref:cellulose-binding domain-containing protein n=1 Tax=Actinoplanes sp. KI2 TaxID=2983315 RepID=UPI0021D6082F|nr:cellulose-binding domain-containing protein [Actinoplanes sp. KI2]MCU7725333.1 cellulose-binding domain-containing protein [Actinoplanes sp. KI2]